VTTQGENNGREQSRDKTLPSVAPSARRSLDDWIQYTEAEGLPEVRTKDGVVHVYSEYAKRTMPTVQAPTQTASDDQPLKCVRIRNQFQILWADVEFWKQVVSKKVEAVPLLWFIQANHGLCLPDYSPQTWKELVKKRAKRENLIDILCQQEWHWLGEQATLDSERVMGELKNKWFKTLLDKYFDLPRTELTRTIASHEFSKAALEAIKAMASRLAEDVDWCLENPGKIPVETPRQSRGRPPDLIVIRRIERLVELRREQPQLSDVAAMRTYTKGKEDDAVRKSAAVARELLRFREGIAVAKS